MAANYQGHNSPAFGDIDAIALSAGIVGLIKSASLGVIVNEPSPST